MVTPKALLRTLDSQVTNKSDKTIQVVRFDFVHPINISGSPYKGRQDAPVVLAIFSDFQ